MNNLKYLSNIIDSDSKNSPLDLTFNNNLIEEKYFIYNIKREKFRIKLGCILMVIGYIVFLIGNEIAGRSTIPNIIMKISGIVIDITITIFQVKYFSSEKSKMIKITKIIRFLIYYCIFFGSITLTYSTLDNSTLSNQLNTNYPIIVMSTSIILMYFLDFNMIYFTLYTLITAAIHFLNVFYFLTNSNLLTNFSVGLSMFVTSFICLYQRDILNLNRKMFFEKHKNEKISNYIQQLLCDLNLIIISMKKDEILYINKKIEFEFEDKENLITKPEELINDNNEKYANTNTLKFLNNIYNIEPQLRNLKEMTDLWIEDQTIPENEFIRIGQFITKNINEQKSYEIYFRKSSFDSNNILDIVMYDLTKIKKYEKEVCESKYKQKILGKIAHEFKTPLITISSIINAIDNKNENKEELLEKFGHIKNLSDYTVFLISDVISYVSEKKEKLEVVKLAVDMKDITSFSFNVLKTLIECNENKKKSVITKLEFDEDISTCIVMSDEIRLKQILLNLLSNSYKFTKNGEIKLCARLDKVLNVVKIYVKDTGIGISPDIEDKILKEDIELNVEAEYNKYGSGIGLSITKMLSNLLNHKVTYHKRKKGGTKFTLEIDVKLNTLNINSRKSNESRETTKMQDYYFSKIIEISGSKENENCYSIDVFGNEQNIKNDISNSREKIISIVIIDDIKYVRDQTKNLITQIFCYFKFKSYEIYEGSDGIELLQILRSDQESDLKIKMIFIDENMEYLNGSETIKIIKGLEKSHKFKKYQIISVTAFEDNENKELILNSGADSIVNKPCSKNQLMKLLKPLTMIN